MRLRTIIICLTVLIAAFAGATFGMQFIWPEESGRKPELAAVPALPPASGTSVIVTPITITHAALRDALDANAPRDIAGKRDYPPSKFLSNAEVAWTVARGPLAVYGKPEILAVTTALTGAVRATAQVSGQATGRIGNVIGGILGQDAARHVEKLGTRPIDERADLRGNLVVLARPAITPQWRIEPNLTPQLTLGEITVTVAGARLKVGEEIKPQLEKQANEHVAKLAERLRNDPVLEQAARREWAKLCRSFPIGAAAAGLPNVWLELRPRRAVAAQPRVDGEAVTLTIGLEADTRILPNETKPDCPFPATLAIVPQSEGGRVSIALPIDVPFTEVNRLMAARLEGRTFPEDGSGSFTVTVRRVNVTPSGDRLLISLQARLAERTSWFGFGTQATVYIWGRPVLDREAQVLRLADVTLDVESEGAMGAVARAAAPYLQNAVAERAVIELKPFAANARQRIEAALADFRAAGDGVRIDAVVDDLRIAGIAFDASNLRVVAEADGAAKVSVTKLPGR